MRVCGERGGGILWAGGARGEPYLGLLLPHLNVAPLCLGEVVPDLLVTCSDEDSLDLTD